jgi:hypothetical protein
MKHFQFAFLVFVLVFSYYGCAFAKNSVFNSSDVKNLTTLDQDFSRLSNDISQSQHGIVVTSISGMEERECLLDMRSDINIIHEASISLKLLITLSTSMTEESDETNVNNLLVLSIDHLKDVFSVEREYANSVVGICSHSPLVISYSQDLKRIIDDASIILDSLRARASDNSLPVSK